MITGNAISGTNWIKVNRIVFTSSGTYTPSANLLRCVVEAVGGGGGGGGCTSTSGGRARSSPSGAAGGYCLASFTPVQVGASRVVTIGGGGSASGGSAGANGGNTSFGALCSALGGRNAGSGTGTNGVLDTWSVMNGGTPVNVGFSGTVLYGCRGQPTQSALCRSSSSSSQRLQICGMGPYSMLAKGSPDTRLGGYNDGINAINRGGAGCGTVAANNGASPRGGTGQPGLLIITEYLGGVL